MQIGDGHAAVPGGADASKVRCVRHVPGTDFGMCFSAVLKGMDLAVG